MSIISVGSVFPVLTKRQREVCALTAKGLMAKDIARRLGISIRTVEDHRQDIRKALGVSRVEEVLYKLLGSPEITA